jgi:hypothetical protein
MHGTYIGKYIAGRKEGRKEGVRLLITPRMGVLGFIITPRKAGNNSLTS